MAPWLLGLALRFSARSQASQRSQVEAEAQRDQAAEIARLRDEQTRLAHDVHDVVGHSLAVILAQAESAQFRDDDDTEALKQTMTNIATSARGLAGGRPPGAGRDVRRRPAPAARQADLDSLVDGVRASGHEVESTLVGRPQPLPPELEVVAFRVLQEMLTNAIKHGRRDQPVRVERHWEGDLRIEVRNDVTTSGARRDPADRRRPGAGDSRDRGPPRARASPACGAGWSRWAAGSTYAGVSDPPTFTATAWVPLRAAR